MSDAIGRELFQNLTFELSSDSDSCILNQKNTMEGDMTLAEMLTQEIADAVRLTSFPANNWYFYYNVLLEGYLPDADTALFGSERKGLPRRGIIVAVGINRIPAIRNLALRVTPIFSNKIHALNT
jgi:hypothetical protein